MKPPPVKPNWERIERTSRLAARDEYRNSSPGARVEEQIELSRELTKLAARRPAGR